MSATVENMSSPAYCCSACSSKIASNRSAEALALGKANDPASTLVNTDELFEAVRHHVGTPSSGEQTGGWKVAVPLSIGDPQPGWLSLDDVLEIRRQEGGDQDLRKGVTKAIQMLNAKWVPLEFVAHALNRDEKLTLGGFLRWLVETK
jgi:hypothetical protein